MVVPVDCQYNDFLIWYWPWSEEILIELVAPALFSLYEVWRTITIMSDTKHYIVSEVGKDTKLRIIMG